MSANLTKVVLKVVKPLEERIAALEARLPPPPFLSPEQIKESLEECPECTALHGLHWDWCTLRPVKPPLQVKAEADQHINLVKETLVKTFPAPKKKPRSKNYTKTSGNE